MKVCFLILRIILVALFIIFIPQSNAQVPDTVPLTNLKAGVAKVDITPPIGIPMAGYGAGRLATGIRDPLYAAVVVFDDGENRAAIVSLSTIAIPEIAGSAIKEAIKEVAGIPGDYVIINASHTHGSPWLGIDEGYRKDVVAKVAGATYLAVGRLRPVSIGYGEGEIDFNISRRWVDENGIAHSKLNPEGICDHRVKVLRIDDGDDIAPMAIIMHAVCHPNVLRGTNTEISADFPGVAQEFVERNFGNRTKVMFLQGCAADIRSNMPPVNGGWRSGSKADMTWCGWTLGSEVVRVATKLRVREQVKERRKEYKISAASDVLNLKENPEKIENMKKRRDPVVNDNIIFPIRAIKIGNIWFVGLSGEPVVEYGLKIEEDMKELGYVFVMGYTTRDAGYIVNTHMLTEGGYEARQSPCTEDCESEILRGVHRLVYKLNEKAR